jgi:hypothetical protein
MRSLEKMLLAIEEYPWVIVYRTAVGFILLPLFGVLPVTSHIISLPLFFVSALSVLKIGPAILRRLISFSEQAESTWAARRQFAKRYDSYQWRKLRWIGVGLAGYLGVSGDRRPDAVALSIFCLLAGAAGAAVWRRRYRSIASAAARQLMLPVATVSGDRA